MRRHPLIAAVALLVAALAPGGTAHAGSGPGTAMTLEFRDAGQGFAEIPEFRFGTPIVIIVVSHGVPVPDLLPLAVTGHAGGAEAFEFTISDARGCDGQTRCSGSVQALADPGDGSIVIEVRNEDGNLLVRHVQGDAEAAVGTRADDATAAGSGGGETTQHQARDGGSDRDLMAIILGSVAALGLTVLAIVAIQRRRRGEGGDVGGGDEEEPRPRGTGSEAYTTTTDAERGKLEVERDRLRGEIDAEWRTDNERSRLQQQLDQVEKELDEVRERQRREREGPHAPDESDFSPPDQEDAGPTYRG